MNMTPVLAFLAQRRKAIAAFIGPLVVGLLAKYAVHVDVNVLETLIVSIITSGTVHQLPNATDTTPTAAHSDATTPTRTITAPNPQTGP